MKPIVNCALLLAAFATSSASAVSLNKSQCRETLGDSFGLELSISGQLIIETSGYSSDCILINDQFLVNDQIMQIDVEVQPGLDLKPTIMLSITSSSGNPLATTSASFIHSEQTLHAETDFTFAQLKVYRH